MKCIWSVVSILLIFSSRSYCQNTCPLNLPFHFTIQIQGSYDSSEQSTAAGFKTTHDTTPEVHTYEFSIDTSAPGSRFVFNGNSVLYNDSTGDVWSDPSIPVVVNQATIHFDVNLNTITALTLDYRYTDSYMLNELHTLEWSVSGQNFQYSSDSIFSASAGLAIILDTEQDSYQYDTGPPFIWQAMDWRFVSGTGQISGSHIEKANVASGQRPCMTISIASGNIIGSSFEASTHSGTLEVYSPLGVRIASYEIAAGQTSAGIAVLTPGLYLIRLDGSLLKVYLPE